MFLKALIRNTTNKFRNARAFIKEYVLNSSEKEAAMGITVGVLIGLIPLIGLTFLIVTLLGIIFRMNQVFLQSAHLLVSPLQLVFYIPFLETGTYFTGNSGMNVISLIQDKLSTDLPGTLQEFPSIIMGGVISWLIFSAISSVLIYRISLHLIVRSKLRE